MVVNGDYHEFEPEKLRGLMKILPEMDEVSLDDYAVDTDDDTDDTVESDFHLSNSRSVEDTSRDG